ncbi:hypothetical protein KAS08_04745 [Candidatus Pacearchaeota archaeon]|nr:hypothetical protein [Candidatus Pacearchaeota archaeon]
MNKRGYFDKRLLFIPLGIVIIVVAVLLLSLGYNECDSWECFNSGLERCSRTKFIGGTKMIFEYTIKGSKGEECEVGVQLLQGELNNKDSLKLEGNKMICMLPKGVVMIPESNIGNCHGLLKEGLQDLIIRKLHTYLVQNLGRLNLEILEV